MVVLRLTSKTSVACELTLLYYTGKFAYSLRRTPHDLAWDIVLRDRPDSGMTELICALFNDLPSLAFRDFTLLHKIVLGLVGQDLDSYLHSEFAGDINALDKHDRTAIWWAASRGKPEDVMTLLSHGANPNIPDAKSTFALHEAVRNGHQHCAKMLLAYGAQVDCRTLSGDTPLHHASQFPQVRTRLAHHDAYPQDADALAVAVRSTDQVGKICIEDLQYCRAMIENQKDRDSAAEMLGALRRLGASMTDLLCGSGSDIEAINDWHETSLWLAVRYDCDRTVALLLGSYKADPTRIAYNGRTILHACAEFAHRPTLNVVAEANLAGLYLEQRDRDGDRPIDRIRWRDDSSLESLSAIESLLNSVWEQFLHRENPPLEDDSEDFETFEDAVWSQPTSQEIIGQVRFSPRP
jgi:ankyrin repeat protein